MNELKLFLNIVILFSLLFINNINNCTDNIENREEKASGGSCVIYNEEYRGSKNYYDNWVEDFCIEVQNEKECENYYKNTDIYFEKHGFEFNIGNTCQNMIKCKNKRYPIRYYRAGSMIMKQTWFNDEAFVKVEDSDTIATTYSPLTLIGTFNYPVSHNCGTAGWKFQWEILPSSHTYDPDDNILISNITNDGVMGYYYPTISGIYAFQFSTIGFELEASAQVTVDVNKDYKKYAIALHRNNSSNVELPFFSLYTFEKAQIAAPYIIGSKLLIRKVLLPGNYYIHVNNYNNPSTIGGYSISITEGWDHECVSHTSPLNPDIYEPDDSFDILTDYNNIQTNWLAVGCPYRQDRYLSENDSDWIKINIPE
jgi:hypothetical protein